MSAITAPDLAIGLFMAFVGACMSVGLSLWLEGNGTAARWRAKLAERKKPRAAELGDFPSTAPKPSKEEIDRVIRNFTVLLFGISLMIGGFFGLKPLLLHYGASESLITGSRLFVMFLGLGVTAWALAGSDGFGSRWQRLGFAAALPVGVMLIIALSVLFGGPWVAAMAAGAFGAILMLRRSSSAERG